MVNDEFGAIVFEQVGIPAFAGMAVAGFVALLLAFLVAIRQLRSRQVSPGLMLSPHIVTLSVAAVLIGQWRMGELDHLGMYGLAYPAFFLFLPMLCSQVLILLPLAYRGLTHSNKQWGVAAWSALPLVLAASATYAGAIKLGASESLVSLGVAFDANSYGVLRLCLYLLLGVSIGLICLVPLEKPEQISHRRIMWLGIAATVIAGELSGQGLGLYVFAQALPGLVAQGGLAALDLMYDALLIEILWGYVVGATLLTGGVTLSRFVWTSQAGEHVKYSRAESVALSLLGLLVLSTAGGLFVQKEEVAQVLGVLMGG